MVPAVKSGDVVTLTVYTAAGIATAAQTTFTPGAGPVPVTGLKITITITVP